MACDGASTRVAVIGGGITGAVCSREILKTAGKRVNLTIFDQGRGLGGRTSHRRINEDGNYSLPTAQNAAYAFDHGCQFFRGDDSRFKQELLHEWIDRNWAAEWVGDFGSLSKKSDTACDADFFGFPSQPPYYCGVGGMSALPCALLADAEALGATVKAGVRVARTARLSSGKWLLSGTSGQAAFHDTAEEEAARVAPDVLGEFDVVVVTDVSASMAGWHRASAGIPEEIASQVRDRTRVVLFTALIAFETPLNTGKDAFAAVDETLWFAGRTQSKPGLSTSATFDCWTLVSTPKYAAAEIERVPMQDPETGAFRPQDMSYIRDTPSAALLKAFEGLLEENGFGQCIPLPKVVYVGGQRWGSAFPAPVGVHGRDAKGCGETTVKVLNVAYDNALHMPLAPEFANGKDVTEDLPCKRPHKDDTALTERNFLADDDQRIYYASDYVSTRLPGVESAALSGLDAARHIVATCRTGSCE